MSRFIALLFFIMLVRAFGQAGPTLLGTAFTPHNLLTPSAQVIVAPGQIATLQVIGLKTVLSQAITANHVPLPTVLAGISVTIEQEARGVGTSLPVPLLSVAQSGLCGSDPSPPDCTVTSITVEIPIETIPLLIDEAWPVSQIVISENGVDSPSFPIVARPANTHVVTGCGAILGACVTHVDGSLITGQSPAKAGETIVIYAYGLGQTTPPVSTGTATPIPAPTAANAIFVDFNFSLNAGPRYPYVDPGPGNSPAFAGLTPGEIGLYQVNVKLPDDLPAMSACSSKLSPIYSAVQSNLTIEIVTYASTYGRPSDAAGPSYDAAPICVQPPPIQ